MSKSKFMPAEAGYFLISLLRVSHVQPFQGPDCRAPDAGMSGFPVSGLFGVPLHIIVYNCIFVVYYGSV